MFGFIKRLFGFEEKKTPVPEVKKKYQSGREIRDAVRALDLSSVSERFKRKKKWNVDISPLEEEYRRFLYLVTLHPYSQIVPWTQDLDDYWHEHILDTRKYNEDCLKIRGKVIHHSPHLPKGTNAHTAAAQNTNRLYREEYDPMATLDIGELFLWNASMGQRAEESIAPKTSDHEPVFMPEADRQIEVKTDNDFMPEVTHNYVSDNHVSHTSHSSCSAVSDSHSSHSSCSSSSDSGHSSCSSCSTSSCSSCSSCGGGD